MIGCSLAALPEGSDVPWQRVMNKQGRISPHGDGMGSGIQGHLLEEEGVIFDLEGRIDWDRFGWLETE